MTNAFSKTVRFGIWSPLLVSSAMGIGVGCSSDSPTALLTSPSEAVSSPGIASARELSNATLAVSQTSSINPGPWIEAEVEFDPPVVASLCFTVSADGRQLTSTDSICDLGSAFEIEIDESPGCNNSELDVGGDIPIVNNTATIREGGRTATVRFTSHSSAVVEYIDTTQPGCTFTFPNVSPETGGSPPLPPPTQPPIDVSGGHWIEVEVDLSPPTVAEVCFHVAPERGVITSTGSICGIGKAFELEIDESSGCNNSELKVSGDIPIVNNTVTIREGGKAARITFKNRGSAIVEYVDTTQPGCRFTFPNVSPEEDEPEFDFPFPL